MKESVITRSEAETRAFAASCLIRYGGARVFALRGEMGSGKTVFVRGIAEAIGVGGAVTSPTFTLIQEYPEHGGRRLVHADLYRLEKPAELLFLGWDDYLEDPGVLLLVEWADRAESLMPRDTLWVTLEMDLELTERRITVEWMGTP